MDLFIKKNFSFIGPTYIRSGCDTMSIFKRGFIGLNLEFSNSYTDWYTKIKESSLPYYLTIAGGRISQGHKDYLKSK